MIAIPVDSATAGVKSSKLFGNAPMFAFYEPEEEQFFIMHNQGEGNGIATANFLKEQGARSVVYTHMGEGLFKALHESQVNVYYLGKEPKALFEIIASLDASQLVKVEPDNAAQHLDPGTSSDACQCGCNHD